MLQTINNAARRKVSPHLWEMTDQELQDELQRLRDEMKYLQFSDSSSSRLLDKIFDITQEMKKRGLNDN